MLFLVTRWRKFKRKGILLATVSHNNNQGSHVKQVFYRFSELNEGEFCDTALIAAGPRVVLIYQLNRKWDCLSLIKGPRRNKGKIGMLKTHEGDQSRRGSAPQKDAILTNNQINKMR